MTEIAGSSLVEQAVGRWDPSDLAYISKFQYEAEPEHGEARVVIHALFQRRDASDRGGWPSDQKPFWTVILEFLAVRSLELKSAGSGPIQVTGFSLEDLSARGMEGVNFRVHDYEEGRLEFYCSTVRIHEVQRV